MPDVEVGEPRAPTNRISRRRFIGYLIAAPTLVAGADLLLAPPAGASVPTVQPVDLYDLTDLLTDAANLTASLITVTINPDGTASFALPRAEVGQGITTAIAMVIADELELPLDKVNITLSDARPELEFNQLTGGSNSMHALYDQVRIAAATARGQLATTAANQLETPVRKLRLKDGVVTAPDGRSLSYGSLTRAAAAPRTRAVVAHLKEASQQTLVGTPQPRIDAMAIVLNGKQVSVDCAGDLRLLWVLRDLLGVHGPKYGCGLDVCKACTCHINGKAFNPCSVPVSDIQPTDQITTIEGLPATVSQPLHPMQQAWLKYDVAQCGYCQPGQIMAAVALVNEINATGRSLTDADLDSLRNICRCGTYPRIREAVVEAAANM